MEINEALKFFENLKNEATEKSEIKVYEKFIGILSDLSNRNFTKNQISAIALKLSELDLTAPSDDRREYFKRKLNLFEKFLIDKYSLILEDYFLGYGIAFGMLCGILAHYFWGTFSIFGGLLIGLVIGKIMDTKANKEGRVIHL